MLYLFYYYFHLNLGVHTSIVKQNNRDDGLKFELISFQFIFLLTVKK